MLYSMKSLGDAGGTKEHMKRHLIMMACLLGTIFCAHSVDASTWYSKWLYRTEITLNGALIADDLTNFPVLISLTDTALRDVSNAGHVGMVSGSDILFTQADATTKLDHEIESYISTNGALVAWVRVDSLVSNTDAIIYMYYGHNGIPDQQNTNGVWDANFRMVHHLHETSGTHYDSTVYARNGTQVGGVTQDAVGKIGGADDFDGGDDQVQCASVNLGSSWTMGGWFNLDVKNEGGRGMLNIGGAARLRLHEVLGRVKVRYYDGSGFVTKSLFSSISTNAWTHIFLTYNGTTLRGYKNGSAVAVGATIVIPSGAGYIGYGGIYNRFDGTIDEVRFSDVVRSAAWVKTSYANQNNPAAFLSFGAEKKRSLGTVVVIR